MPITFHSHEVSFVLKNKSIIKNWLTLLSENHGFAISILSYIFCSDEYLLSLNQSYLNHNTYTDILTFDSSEILNQIDGEIFISIPRVKDNAKAFNVSFEEELARVMAHGLFHLCGQLDKSKKEFKAMKEKENFAINLFKELTNVPRGTI